MVRHGLIGPDLDYQQLQNLFRPNLQPDVALVHEFHALLVTTRKNSCRPRPRCQDCPLERFPHTTDIKYG